MNRRRFIGGALGLAAATAPKAHASNRPDGICIGLEDGGACSGMVSLNGEVLTDCVLADERGGMVRRLVFGADGNLVHPRQVRTEYGVVRIWWPDHPELEAEIRAQFAIDGTTPYCVSDD